MPSLSIELDRPLPETVSVGAGTAVFVGGRCFHPASRIRSLSFVVDEQRQPVIAHSMPLLDHFRELHAGVSPYDTADMAEDPGSGEDPLMHAYLSGFWGVARIPSGAEGSECVLGLEAVLEDGSKAVGALGRIERTRLPEPLVLDRLHDGDKPLVAVCMATFDPPDDLLARQLDSIRGQTYDNWVCVISDDSSRPERYAALERAIGGDPRFVLTRSPRRLGFYQNFERALALAPARAAYVAMADQDDFWHPDKLATLVATIGDAQLIFSDARVVARDGSLIADTWWSHRTNNHRDLFTLLVANSVTGAASLMRRELLDTALPFPPAQFAHFHDHWLALVALAVGRIEYVDRPLYDYVQHSQASLGHAGANRVTSVWRRLSNRTGLRERARVWRTFYYVDCCRLTQFATVLEMRCASRMTPDKQRALQRFTGVEDSTPALAGLGVRGMRELSRRQPETLGAEWLLFRGFVWRRLLAATARERPQRTLRLDALPPRFLTAQPGRAGPDGAASVLAEKITPLLMAVSDSAPRRINIMIPTIDLDHFFGGYITKLNLARRLSERGFRVRVLTVDPVPRLPRTWRRTIESYSGLQGVFDHIEVEFGRESPGIEVSATDAFVATTWWTAHLAHRALGSLGADRFLYLIQEYEPFTFPMGSAAALASESYRLPHFALFSSELLRGYFRAHGLGVFADGAESGDSSSVAFQNAITPIDPPTAEELSARTVRRLLFYARPESHAARNMFELGVLALSRALEDGLFSGWELNGIGSVEVGRNLSLGSGATLNLLPRADQDAYGQLVREHDVGLALMYTPHPSLVPIEMASGGMLTVTNSFENKTAAALAEISTNMITAEPTIDAVVEALREAANAVGDVDRRVAGSRVAWSTDWQDSFDDTLLDKLAPVLRGDR